MHPHFILNKNRSPRSPGRTLESGDDIVRVLLFAGAVITTAVAVHVVMPAMPMIALIAMAIPVTAVVAAAVVVTAKKINKCTRQ